jgi:hypothetical protein
MSRVLTFVEIDVPAWTQSSPDSPPTELTFRFSTDTDYIPADIPAIASIKSIDIQPATISLGEDLGQRAVITVSLRDHRHIFNGEAYLSGTFWGKFRARYGLTLSGHPLRLIRGLEGQSFASMEVRYFLIDRTDGPDRDGIYRIVAKDALIFGTKLQAPVLSNGFLDANIGSGAGGATLSPVGIGATYPTFGYIAVGGTEIMGFTRIGDAITFVTRGDWNTTAVAHNAGDRVQLCLHYSANSASFIIWDLLVNFGGIDTSFAPLSDWQNETTAYLGTQYTALIANPTDVDKLVSEVIEQAALAVWWDDVAQQVSLRVLRNIPTDAALYDGSNMLRSTLESIEQPEKRLTEVQVYFSKINPLVQDDEDDNYAGTARVSDDLAVTEYGLQVIKKIRSRWIPSGGRAVAETLANKLLGRFRDPPRLIKFEVMRDQPIDPILGTGYQVAGIPFQTSTGADDTVPVQITRLTPWLDRFSVEAEEMLWTPFGADINPSTRTIIFDVSRNSVNLRTIHDSLYSAPTAGNTINATILAGVTIGSTHPVFEVAFAIGSWPGGVTINLTVHGRIQGAGGFGGSGGSADDSGSVFTGGTNGGSGGTALYTRVAINLTYTDGQIWGGGGGGGGGGAIYSSGDVAGSGGGGGGGSGTIGGVYGVAGNATGGHTAYVGNPGSDGSAESGGAGGLAEHTGDHGGAGGAPSFDGQPGISEAAPFPPYLVSAAGLGGAHGPAIDGGSFVTVVGAAGDLRGGQIN